MKSNEADIRFGLDLICGTNQDPMFYAQDLDIEDGDTTFVDACSKVREKSRKWSRSRSTQGLGLGEKISDCKPTGELCLKVYVDRKRPRSKLANPVPKTVEVPELGKLLTDVEEIGVIEMQSMTSRTRPVIPGCSVGHTEVNAGTFGCLVTRKTDPGKLFILSNSHILAVSGQADVGDKIIQPGKYDNGKVTLDTVASLAEFEAFDYGSGYPNLIDAAIAEAAPGIELVSDIRSLDYSPIGISSAIKRDMKVQKVGRTSDLTVGIVRDIDFRTRFPYLVAGKRKTIGFQDVVLCSQFTSPGDSGSAVLNMSKRLVGLHFAGSPSASIFCKITNVFNLLELDLP